MMAEGDCNYTNGCDHELYTNDYLETKCVSNFYFCKTHLRLHHCGGTTECGCIITEEGVCTFSNRKQDSAAEVYNFTNIGFVEENAPLSLPNSTELLMNEIIGNLPPTDSCQSIFSGDYGNFHSIVYRELMVNCIPFRKMIEKITTKEEGKDVESNKSLRERRIEKRKTMDSSYELIRCIYDAAKSCDKHLNLSNEKLLELLAQFIVDMSNPKNKYHFNYSPKDSGIMLQKKKCSLGTFM